MVGSDVFPIQSTVRSWVSGTTAAKAEAASTIAAADEAFVSSDWTHDERACAVRG